MIQAVVPNPKLNPQTNSDLKTKIDQILELNKSKPGSLMVILNEVQAKLGIDQKDKTAKKESKKENKN